MRCTRLFLFLLFVALALSTFALAEDDDDSQNQNQDQDSNQDQDQDSNQNQDQDESNDGPSGGDGMSDDDAGPMTMKNPSLNSSATDEEGPMITKHYATLYNYTSPGGADANLVKYIPMQLNFGKGAYPNSSHNSTGKGDTTVVGVKVLDSRELQPVYGAGCGLTDASSISMQDLKSAHPDTYEEIMKLLWAQDQDEMDKAGGAGMMFVRSPLGACDFGTNVYSYDDIADCSPDVNLTQFSIEKAPKMWSTHKDIQDLNPDINTWWAPWSPPAWMKSSAQNCSLIGGSLEEKYEDVFAEYLTKSMVAIKKKLGKAPSVLSVQNEPLYTSDKYPGSKLSPEAGARVSQLVRKKLDAEGLQHLGLSAYDHNWDKPDYPIAEFDNKSAFDSVSWHCYGGTPAKQEEFTRVYPDIPQYMSECTRVTQNLEEPWINLRKNAENLLIGSIGSGARNMILWNCVLQADENGFTFPSLPGTCQNCNAPVLVYQNQITSPKMNASGLFVRPPTQTSSGPPRQHHFSGKPHHNGRHKRADDAKSDDSKSDGGGSEGGKADGGKPDGGKSNGTDADAPKSAYKLTSDYAVLVHLNRATRLQAKGEKTAIRTGVSSTEQGVGNLDSERVKAQAYKIKLPNGKFRFSLIVLQRNDYFLSGRFEPVNLILGFQNMIANITDLPVGLHTFQWEA